MKNRYLVAIIALLMALVIGASLVACTPSGDNGETTTTEATDPQQDEPTTPAQTTTDETTEATTTEEITEPTEPGLQPATDVKDNGFSPVEEFK